MRKIIILSVLLTTALMVNGCAVALWAGTMAIGAKMDKQQQERKQVLEPAAPAEKK